MLHKTIGEDILNGNGEIITEMYFPKSKYLKTLKPKTQYDLKLLPIFEGATVDTLKDFLKKENAILLTHEEFSLLNFPRIIGRACSFLVQDVLERDIYSLVDYDSNEMLCMTNENSSRAYKTSIIDNPDMCKLLWAVFANKKLENHEESESYKYLLLCITEIG